ncbi:hypothetical protein CEE37_11080 [candidate division LCP-89 bacterium B3_LCP]|uniref:FAD-binding PCMH-type domain-containing protein n=1 Tax=candidate division LCP-89 bacterium B3_LCP TaxID=2012998 RepID=A0A532UY35_UNCL8|nr:MAG: hypothetical protein CEE37_11080 [candidate division LCP-89 bacterium B3_LCP]
MLDQNLRDVFLECGCQVLDQLLPRIVLLPSNREAISRLIKIASSRTLHICATGTGQSFPVNYQPKENQIFLLTTQMNQLLELKHLDASVVVESGILTSKLAERLEGTQLDFPEVLSKYSGTMAGAVLGPDTQGLRHAELRRRILGVEIIDPKGRLLKFGSHAIKNVAGYDYWSFLVGTRGRFGIATRFILNLERMPLLDTVPHPGKRSDSLDNPSEWIYANLCKRLDPDGIFVQ